MQRIGKMFLVLAVIVLVFGGTNAFATTRRCLLSDSFKVESTNSCTVKYSTNTYKVVANHSPGTNSNTLKIGLNEWDLSIYDYKYRQIFTLPKNTTTVQYPSKKTGPWAKLRLTAGASKATGTGIITNEF